MNCIGKIICGEIEEEQGEQEQDENEEEEEEEHKQEEGVEEEQEEQEKKMKLGVVWQGSRRSCAEEYCWIQNKYIVSTYEISKEQMKNVKGI